MRQLAPHAVIIADGVRASIDAAQTAQVLGPKELQDE